MKRFISYQSHVICDSLEQAGVNGGVVTIRGVHGMAYLSLLATR